MMRADDVIEVIDALEDAGVDVWVDGGWGIDALLGEQTRPHDDIDVLIRMEDVDDAVAALKSLGFVMMTDELPQGFVLRGPADRRIDFHPVRFQVDGSGAQAQLNAPDWLYSAAGLLGSGLIGGCQVRCLTPEEQVRTHLGYSPEELDRQDMRVLHERFGVLLPPPYGSDQAPPS